MEDGPARMPVVAGHTETDRTFPQAPPGGLLVAVLLTRPTSRLDEFAEVMLSLAGELAQLGATILLMNDLSGDTDLAGVLEAVRTRLCDQVPVLIVENQDSLGFVGSANEAMRTALSSDRDILLLDPDAIPRPGSLTEMLAVAYLDPLTAVVSPRSDKTGITASPLIGGLLRSGPDVAFRAHEHIQHHLPRYSYVPAADSACLLIRRLMLAEFGFLDAIYGGVLATDDFIRRCNRRGYRAVLANRAYVHLPDDGLTADFAAERDRAILTERYPEHDRALARHFAGVERHAERAANGLVPRDGRLRLLFDCRVLAPSYNGTIEHMCRLLEAFAGSFSDRYDISVLCDEEAFRFHELDQVQGLRHCREEEALRAPAAIAFRLSQPDMASLISLCRFGAVTGALMLDTIAMDCPQLDDGDLHRIWSIAATGLDVIGFNSEFTRDQFGRRFSLSDRTVQAVSLCSTDIADYADGAGSAGKGGGILLIGNEYPHKHLQGMVDALAATGSTLAVRALGVELDRPGIVTGHLAGGLAKDVVDRLYADADVVLYPSHYEGFGLPIMHALARRSPVIARDLPCAREIRARCSVGQNLHLCASTGEMARLAASPPAWIDEPLASDLAIWTWRDAARALADAFDEGLRRFTYASCCHHQGNSATLIQAGQAEALHATVARLEEGLDLARGASRRFDAEIYDLNDRLTIAAEREDRARSALRDAEAAEQGERLVAQRATERAEIAETRRKAALEAQRAAEADVDHARAAASEANQRADRAETREMGAHDILRTLVAIRARPATPVPAPSFTAIILDWIVSRGWPRRSAGDLPEAVALAGLRLEIMPQTPDDEASRAGFLRWSRRVMPGGDARIELAEGAAAKDGTALATLLSLAGFAVKWWSSGLGRTIVRVTKAQAWPDFDMDGPRFADLICLYCLGREPDDSEREAIDQRLHLGTSRIDIAIEMAASQECWDRWRLGGPAEA